MQNTPFGQGRRFYRYCTGGIDSRRLLGWAAALMIGLCFATGSAAESQSAHLVAKRTAKAPAGFQGLCARLAWVCTSSSSEGLQPEMVLKIADEVNRKVNRHVREVDDLAQYGVEEYWGLPTKRGGDCEDLVLLKKKLLLQRGVPSGSLLIATVLDRSMGSHAVLVLRTAAGDYVLDNLTHRILPWSQTGYTFLKLQNPRVLSRWDVVLAGGLMDERPTASR